ncbi:potassium channel subfamily K member 16-like [Anneissia japonica]|uniref:potassium channel subfamily K member 16-like n=1 Tax=Anneissia japonica TaxID=1529436 RepID=UPI00142569CA|nr:potassium channel subfamily K member 16-like [Anneissia japonica]
MAFVSNKKQFGLFILLLLLFSGYLTIGALCFRYFESSYHAQVDSNAVELVGQFCVKYNCVDEQDLLTLIFAVTGLSYGRHVHHLFNVSSTRWENFHETFFFSATIVTTIGYGDMVPQTNLGRWFCILYACIGIPLTAVFVSHIGTIFMKLWKVCFRFFTKNVCRSRKEQNRLNRLIRIVTALLMSLLTFTCLISLPAWGLTLMEEWTVNESYYFCFISLSTIGFGDYVIGASERHRHQVVLRYVTILYLITGLSVLTAIFKAIVDYNTKKVKKLSFTAEKFIKRKAPKFAFKKEIDDEKISLEEFPPAEDDRTRIDSKLTISSISHSLTVRNDINAMEYFGCDKSTQT